MNILIPAAGRGSRFLNSQYSLPKPLIMVNNAPMLISSAKSLSLEGNYIFIVQDNEFTEILSQHIYTSFPQSKIAVIDYYTEGAAQTALIAEQYINNDDELVIANCDQIMNYSVSGMLNTLRNYDSGLVLIKSKDSKHSYAKVEKGFVTLVKEKEVISNFALTGIHYWKKGKYFVESAITMINENSRSSNNEFYIGPTYNYLIKSGKSVGTYLLETKEIHFIGTPEDLELYESRKIK